ncbi:helix-turn-helix transcriptional regulator [Pantanalinema rosaneae CENA516]|uniref:helix-turn-helix transcriptional regulator n=1 Tax=Pantanalinema rosaneae TaxID=1620701 RepID=UPI003D6FBF57
MAIALSQAEYWALFSEETNKANTIDLKPDSFEIVQQFPRILGNGSLCEISLREGLDLAIADYSPRDHLILHCPEREHSLEYSFFLSGKFKDQLRQVAAGQYVLYGSGIAPVEWSEWLATERVLEVNVHIDPALFIGLWNQASTGLHPELQHLLQPDTYPYCCRLGTTTTAMQNILQQILKCPFVGITKRIYLESKVWELMALLIDQEFEQGLKPAGVPALKRDDVDRIYFARDILLRQFDNPPSLLELARQVGLNDCTLKRGFRQVFGNTAFGYLHEYRLEQARKLLEEGRLNVSEVARRIGFVNRSYFASAFRKKFGVTPKEYLVRHRNSA